MLFWGLKLQGGNSGAGLSAMVTQAAAPGVQIDPQAMARLMGAGAARPAAAVLPNASSRFALAGVVAGRHGGAALIAVDGKPPRPFRVGSRVDEGLILQSVSARRASLAPQADAPAVLTLEMAPLKK